MSYPPQGNKADVGTIGADVTTLLTRLSATRAGYLDELAAANLPTDVGNLLTRLTAARAGYLENINNVTLKTLAAMRGTDSAALASSWTAALATALGNYNATRAGYLDALNRDRPDMVFPSVASAGGIVVLPAVAADLDFPSVVVADLPSGLTIARADLVLVIGALFDTSASENQIAAAAKTLRVKLSTGSWGTDDIVALTFAQNGLQVDGDAYRGGPVLFGATDISSKVVGNGTYNFRSEETERSEGVTVTGASLELLDVSTIIRVWFN